MPRGDRVRGRAGSSPEGEGGRGKEERRTEGGEGGESGAFVIDAGDVRALGWVC